MVPSPGVYSGIGASGEAGGTSDGGGSGGGSNNGVILPPSDAAISSSIDRPQSGGNRATGGINAAGAVATGVAATPDTMGSSSSELSQRDINVEAGVAAGKDTPRYLVARVGGPMHVMATPWGERKRRGAGGKGKRSGGSAVGRLGDAPLGIVGTRTSLTSEDQ